jgi:hypothetical protein
MKATTKKQDYEIKRDAIKMEGITEKRREAVFSSAIGLIT